MYHLVHVISVRQDQVGTMGDAAPWDLDPCNVRYVVDGQICHTEYVDIAENLQLSIMQDVVQEDMEKMEDHQHRQHKYSITTDRR